MYDITSTTLPKHKLGCQNTSMICFGENLGLVEIKVMLPCRTIPYDKHLFFMYWPLDLDSIKFLFLK